LITAELDAVVNFAAESHVDRSITAPDEFIRTDVFGTFTLLEACRKRGVSRYLQVSTDEVYGSVETGASREEAEKNMGKAVEVHIKGLLDKGMPIPEARSIAEYVAIQEANNS